MAAATYDIELEQGATYQFLLKFVKDGLSLPIDVYDFDGEVKYSIYDEVGFPIRFDMQDQYSVMAYIDADVSKSFDFEKGIYDITMTSKLDGRVVRLLKGQVTVDFGVTL